MCDVKISLQMFHFRYDAGRSGSATGLSGFKLLAVTLKLLKEKKQLLILPITFFIGAEQAFLFADFNAVSIKKPSFQNTLTLQFSLKLKLYTNDLNNLVCTPYDTVRS